MRLESLIPRFIPIPAGPFLMGTPERDLNGLAKAYGGTRESYREESPQHMVTLPAFAIAQTPVTNRLYAQFVAATGARMPSIWRGAPPTEPLADHPVVDVSWGDADTFCAWLNREIENVELKIENFQAPDAHFSIRLPTEAEWERAARWGDGRIFPWGDAWDPTKANTRESGHSATTPVGFYPAGASQAGCLDMAGNVWEWTASLDMLYPYNPADGREDARAVGRRILRGGCYANPHGFARCACRFRLPPAISNEFLGFRLAG
jgi:formylglycine-generating enzyme required for sulfatase activity